MGQELAPIDVFRAQLEERQNELFSILPKGVSQEAFMNTAIMAVKQQPELFQVDRRSLHKAITQAARDGLLPDGKEAVVLPQSEKQRDGSYKKTARYQPMTFGIRKRAREIEGIIIDAQVVRQNDKFVWVQGDEPRLHHEPAPLGTPRGDLVGVYAIFKIGGEVIHREVMDRDQVNAVKSISKQQNGLLWTKFEEEAWRKSVIRRGIKTVPLTSSAMRQIVEADDDLYEVGRGNALEGKPNLALPVPPPAPTKAPPPPPSAPPSTVAPVIEAVAPTSKAPPKPPAPPKVVEAEVVPDDPLDDPGAFLALLRDMMAEAGEDQAAREAVWNEHEDLIGRLGRKDRVTAEKIYEGTEESADG